ncbi:MAG: hypothetical protein U9Q33_06680 [Campylobacterota bacterium]|nr:hypothetical protein [Campylobacterota bacterium]
MSYSDILILGWNLNAFMFVINLFLAVNIVRSNDPTQLEKESKVLNELSQEMEKYYPNRQVETLISYLIPFTAFYRILFKLIEMNMFFSKNKGTKMFDFVIYKYQKEIQKAKNKVQ